MWALPYLLEGSRKKFIQWVWYVRDVSSKGWGHVRILPQGVGQWKECFTLGGMAMREMFNHKGGG